MSAIGFISCGENYCKSRTTSNSKLFWGLQGRNEMPRDSDGKKIDELEKLTAKMTERLDNAVKEIEAVFDAHQETVRELAEVRREHEKDIVILKKEIEDLKKSQERWGQRVWMVLAPLMGAIPSTDLTGKYLMCYSPKSPVGSKRGS